MTKIITFEGIDGSGKSTIIQLVKDELERQNKSVKVLQEPGTTEIGTEIRKLLKSQTPRTNKAELLLFEASRADMVEREIRPSIGKYDYILIDRFIHSTIAYQGYANGNDINLITTLNTIATDNITIDKSILIDVTLEEAYKRRNVRDDIYDKFDALFNAQSDYAQKIYRGYQEMASLGMLYPIRNDTIQETVEKVIKYIDT